MVFRRTKQGWQRISRPKSGIQALLTGWGIGAIALVVIGFRLLRFTGQNSAEDNQLLFVLLAVLCFAVGPVLWFFDRMQSKKMVD